MNRKFNYHMHRVNVNFNRIISPNFRYFFTIRPVLRSLLRCFLLTKRDFSVYLNSNKNRTQTYILKRPWIEIITFRNTRGKDNKGRNKAFQRQLNHPKVVTNTINRRSLYLKWFNSIQNFQLRVVNVRVNKIRSKNSHRIVSAGFHNRQPPLISKNSRISQANKLKCILLNIQLNLNYNQTTDHKDRRRSNTWTNYNRFHRSYGPGPRNIPSSLE